MASQFRFMHQRRGRAARVAALLTKHGYTSAGFCGLRDYVGDRVYPEATSR